MSGRITVPKGRRYWVQDSAVREVCDDVDYLCERLGRPVCSRDLVDYYREFPGERPEFLQAWGQILIKATYPRIRTSPTIVQIGLVRNRAYYAPVWNEDWVQKLRIFKLKDTISRQVTLAMPAVSQDLLHTEFGDIARNALRGFVIEFGPALDEPELRSWKKISSLRRLVSLAEKNASERFSPLPPGDWIDRAAAKAIILREYYARKQAVETCGHNAQRHLSVLRWPQSELFSERGQRFSRMQVLHYCAGRWPTTIEEKIISAGLWRCLRYGTVSRFDRPIDSASAQKSHRRKPSRSFAPAPVG